MVDPVDMAQRAELGAFLRAHRERLTPQALGLVPGARRRTPGLRREELAQLAGVSATWVSWIEQGRDVMASTTALGRLARALRLNPAERAYLFDLARRPDPERPPVAGAGGAAALDGVVAAITTPAYVLDRAWTAIAWNAPAAQLFVGWLDDGAASRNLLRYVFLDPAAPMLIADWAIRAQRLAAEFRADHGRHLAAAEARALVEDLSAASDFFDRAWRAHDVVEREGGERRFNHPAGGTLLYRQTTFLLAPQPDLKLVVLVPVES